MADNNQPVPQVQTPVQQAATQNATQVQPANSNTGYKPSTQNPVVTKSTPIAPGGNYYQARATDLGLMEQSPVASKPLPEMSASLGTGNSSPSYGTGGIFKAPNAKSYESGSSLTSSIPNIMADNNVQSAIGSITQPVSTGIMRSVPNMKGAAPAAKPIDLLAQYKSGIGEI